MATVARGNSAECFVREDLERRGFLVGSRRHIKGAGDDIGVHPGGEVWLVETKALGRKASRFENFRRGDRLAMKETLLPLGASRYLALVRGSGERRTIEYVHERDWPA